MATEKEAIKYITSKGNPYIHNSFSNSGVSDMYGIFSDTHIRAKYAEGASKIRSAITNTYQPPPGSTDILEFLSDLTKDLQETIKNEVKSDKLHTSGEKIELQRSIFNKETAKTEVVKYMKSVSQLNYSGETDFFQIVDGQFKNIQQYLSFLKRAIKDSEVLVNDRAISRFVTGYFLSKKNAEKDIRASFSEFNNALNEFIANNSNRLTAVSTRDLKGSQAKIEKDVARLQGYKTAIEQIQKIYGVEDTKRFLKNGPRVVEKGVNRLGGFLFEPICNDAINMSKHGLLKGLKSEMSGEKDARLTLSPEDQKYRKKKTTKNTEDLSFSYETTDDSVEASVVVREIPGASLKKITYKPGQPEQIAKIKSDNTLGFMFLKAGMTTTTGFYHEYAAVNMIANYRKAGSKFFDSSPMVSMYNYIKAGNLANALAGTLTKGDMSYFFIINHKVFKIPEILDSLSRGEGLFGVDHKLIPSQQALKDLNKYVDTPDTEDKDSNARSENVYSAILSAKMNLELKIASNLFRV